MEESTIQYTAFTTPDKALYQLRVMPFNLKGAQVTFQRLMAQEVFPGYLVYLDDIVIYFPDHETQLEHLRAVLERLQIHGLRCNSEKCYVVSHKSNCPYERHLRQIGNVKKPIYWL